MTSVCNMRAKFLAISILVLVVILGSMGCTGTSTRIDGGSGQQSIGTGETYGDWSHVSLTGTGASFPYPIYAHWAYKFENVSGIRLNYQSMGSGAGISSIQSRTVDYGASDKPLRQDELDEHGLIQFPMIIGGVVPVVNVEGVVAGQLKLSAEVFADIFLGEITQWDDPRITADNPGMSLSDQAIVVVHRADGSGTTWILTSYLSSVSPVWADTIGVGKSIEWPTGIGGRGNEGVASYVQEVAGTIGYVEYAYALQNELTHAMLENRDGNFVAPAADAFAAAAAHADWANAPGYYMVLVDQPGPDTWPIVGASFILFHREQDDMDKAVAMLEYFDWCFKTGQDDALELDYVPIPQNVIEMIQQTWADNVTVNGENVWSY